MFLKTTHRPLLIAGGSCDAVGPAKSQAGCPGAVLVSVRLSVHPCPLAGLSQPGSLLSSSPAGIYWGQGVKPHCRCTSLGARWDFSPFPSPYNTEERGSAGTSPPTAIILQGTGGEWVVRVWGTDPCLRPRHCQLSKCHPVPPSATWGWQRDLGTSHLGMALVPSSAASSPPSSLQPAVGVASCRPYQNRSGPEQVWAPTGAPGSAVPVTGGTCCLLAAEGSSAPGLGSPLGGCCCPQLRFAGKGWRCFPPFPAPRFS